MIREILKCNAEAFCVALFADFDLLHTISFPTIHLNLARNVCEQSR